MLKSKPAFSERPVLPFEKILFADDLLFACNGADLQLLQA